MSFVDALQKNPYPITAHASNEFWCAVDALTFASPAKEQEKDLFQLWRQDAEIFEEHVREWIKQWKSFDFSCQVMNVLEKNVQQYREMPWMHVIARQVIQR